MAGATTLAWIERLVWILIYGGLLAALIGWVTERDSATVGWSLLVGGLGATAAGVVLIWVRSRLRQQPPR